ARATWPSTREVRGRLQHLCSQPASRRASDGEHHSVSHHEAQTQSESGEECSGSAEGQKVLGIQLHGGQGTATAHCAQSHLALQGAYPRADVPDTRSQHRAESERTL